MSLKKLDQLWVYRIAISPKKHIMLARLTIGYILILIFDEWYTNIYKYPHWSGRFNKRGLPIFVFDVVNLNNAAIKSYERTRNLKSIPVNEISPATEKPVVASLSGPQRALIYHDYVTRFLFPLCSRLTRKPENEGNETTHCIYLVNIANMALKQVWDLRNYAQDVSRLLATNYPEVVDRIYVCIPSRHRRGIYRSDDW